MLDSLPQVAFHWHDEKKMKVIPASGASQESEWVTDSGLVH
jgi:hypothetical protein